jgi:PIN domain
VQIFFADTNLFLQCKALPQINWVEVTAGQDIAVLVPAAVQREIDRLKGDGNGRRALRARTANSILRTILRSADEEKVLRDGDPRVVLRIAPKPAERRLYQELDLQWPDDQIVAEALDYRAEHPLDTVRVLSGDTGILLSAKRSGLEAVEIPDAWLLDPEPDRESKQIAELQRRLTALERVHPVLWVEAQDSAGVRIETLNAEIREFPPLSEETLDRLVEEVCTMHPRRDDFKVSPPNPIEVLAGLYRVELPKTKEIENYHNKYQTWVSNIREFLQRLPAILTDRAGRALLRLIVSNEGAAPATGLLVELAAVGGLSFRSEDDEVETKLQLTRPPTPPQGRVVSTMPDFAKMIGFTDPMLGLRNAYVPRFADVLPGLPPLRDPNEFYWKYRRPTEWACTCDEFRHHGDAEVFELTLVGSQTGAINYQVTASNMPEVVKGTVPVRLTAVEGDTAPVAREIIRRSAHFAVGTEAEGQKNT